MRVWIEMVFQNKKRNSIFCIYLALFEKERERKGEILPMYIFRIELFAYF